MAFVTVELNPVVVVVVVIGCALVTETRVFCASRAWAQKHSTNVFGTKIQVVGILINGDKTPMRRQHLPLF